MSERMKQLFVNVFFAFKNNKQKIRLALVYFHSIIKGSSGEDCMIGLELDINN